MFTKLKKKLSGNRGKDHNKKVKISIGTNGEETMHTGFQPYRKKSKHLLDIEEQINDHSPDSLQEQTKTKKKPSKIFKKISLSTTPAQEEEQNRSSLQSTSGGSKGQQVSDSLLEHEDRIKFHSEDEVKEYIVQPRSYKPSITKDPLGLDIFANADHLWLEHANRDEVTNVPILDYNYNAFDDSEQQILWIRPFFQDVQKTGVVPTTFLVLTSIGINLCQLQFRTRICCSSKELVAEVILKGGKHVGSVAKIGNIFTAHDHKGRQIMSMPITCVSRNKISKDEEGTGKTLKNDRKYSFGSKKVELKLPMTLDNFVCNVYVTSRKIEPLGPIFGTIRGNGLEEDSGQHVNDMSESNGFKFTMNETRRSSDLAFTSPPRRPDDPLPTLAKLYVVTTLVALTVYLIHPLVADCEAAASITNKKFTGDLEKILAGKILSVQLPQLL